MGEPTGLFLALYILEMMSMEKPTGLLFGTVYSGNYVHG